MWGGAVVGGLGSDVVDGTAVVVVGMRCSVMKNGSIHVMHLQTAILGGPAWRAMHWWL